MAQCIPELIRKKRDGQELTPQEIQFFIKSVVSKTIDDFQIGSMLMAMYLNGLNIEETISLTKSMIESGETLSFENISKDILVDKHSTGGVGDKISLVLAPALAACGLKVPMLSGRGLGHTGGTLDKLESIPGFQVQLSREQMNNCLTNCGFFISGATESIAPADGILYKVRDITSTVEAPSLIVASILSKKVAEGIGTLAMDVKYGKGSLCKTEKQAKNVAQLLEEVGRKLELKMRVVISDMNVPLGKFVGNALEIIESVMCLRNEVKNSVTDLVKLLGGVILETTGRAKTIEEGEKMIEKTLEDLSALDKFFQMLLCQGVSEKNAADLISGEYWKVLPKTPHVTYFRSSKKGVVEAIDALDIAKACWYLGAGRVKAEDKVDHSVGVILLKTIGEEINEKEPWIEVHHQTTTIPAEVENLINQSLSVIPSCFYKESKFKTVLL